MRILILGGTGMLGHNLWRYFSFRFPHTYTTIRKNSKSLENTKLFKSDNVIHSVDVFDFSSLTGVMKCLKPDVILNCIGITKRRDEANLAVDTITINSLFPHKLVEWGKAHSALVVNFSTDCVFDGKRGNYSENDTPNATDLYGKTKALGEIYGENALTIRSSFIGMELEKGSELFEWFLSQKGSVKGFTNAIYSGLTVNELCRVVENILVNYPKTTGLYNVSSNPINKYDLLSLIKHKMNLPIEIVPFENNFCDRSIDSTKFRTEFKYSPPTWDAMIEELSREVKERI